MLPSGKEHRFCTPKPWVWDLALPFISCVTLKKYLTFLFLFFCLSTKNVNFPRYTYLYIIDIYRYINMYSWLYTWVPMFMFTYMYRSTFTKITTILFWILWCLLSFMNAFSCHSVCFKNTVYNDCTFIPWMYKIYLPNFLFWFFPLIFGILINAAVNILAYFCLAFR